MFYIVYETTNNANGKKYRGVHKTDNLNDGYIGSGKVMLQAVKKYGKSQFSRVILEFCDSFEHALERERVLVDATWVADRTNYNAKIGGLGSVGMVPWNKGAKGAQEAWNKGVEMGPMSDEGKQQRSQTVKEYWANNPHPRKGQSSWNAGKEMGPAHNKGKVDEKYPCPHCGKQVNKGNLRRWHLDNCRLKA